MAPILTRPPSEEIDDLYSPPNIELPLGEYLFHRICQANPKLKSVFGIPGDFTLPLLEYLYTDSVSRRIEFVGFCNELNAAYAADGYAKCIEGMSVLLTTYGVGELSALNGIAGAFTEYVPILHIVGTTSTAQIEQAKSAKSPNDVRNIHHLLQNRNPLLAPDHDVYKSVAGKVSVVQESLDNDVFSNLDKIDRVLSTIIHEKRPGYLFMPCDICDIMVPMFKLNEPLQLSELRNESLLSEISSRILMKLYLSERPSVLEDALVDRFGAQRAFNDLISLLPENFVKLFTSLFARNVDESLPNFMGVYAGKASSTLSVAQALEKESDFLLCLGYTNNEINTGAYSTDYTDIAEYVEVHPDYVLIDGEYVEVKDSKSGTRHFSINDLIQRLATDFNPKKLAHNNGREDQIRAKPKRVEFSYLDNSPSETITQNKLMDFFNSYLKSDDILVCETCSFLFGAYDLTFPKGVKFYAQNLYESIGYALPATFGVARAQKDLGVKRRIILVQGDGSAQMTIQEFSTYLRYDIEAPEIFLLNNEGYTVERMIKGPTRPYNDIQDTWKWTEIFKVFGDEECIKHEAGKISTMSELNGLFPSKKSSKIRLHELKLAKLDIPRKFGILRE